MHFTRTPYLPVESYPAHMRLRSEVARAIEWAVTVNETTPRPLRIFFDDVVSKFATWNKVRDSDLVPAPDYPRAMRLRDEVQRALDYSRLYPNSRADIAAFFGTLPNLIQFRESPPVNTVDSPTERPIPVIRQSGATQLQTTWLTDGEPAAGLSPRLRVTRADGTHLYNAFVQPSTDSLGRATLTVGLPSNLPAVGTSVLLEVFAGGFEDTTKVIYPGTIVAVPVP